MNRLKIGYVDMQKVQASKTARGTRTAISVAQGAAPSLDTSSVDSARVIQAQRNMVYKRQNVTFSNMEKELGRDLKMYKQINLFDHITLDNHKEERMEMMKNRSYERNTEWATLRASFSGPKGMPFIGSASDWSNRNASQK